jgi:hypothetical protein
MNVVITRHPALRWYLIEQGIIADTDVVLTHAEAGNVEGKARYRRATTPARILGGEHNGGSAGYSGGTSWSGVDHRTGQTVRRGTGAVLCPY